MPNSPFFTIQIAAFNVEQYIKHCLDSLLTQSEQDFEIILVDDCSTDNTGKICDEYAKEYQGKVVSVHNEENLGLLLTRRVAYKLARGKWILSVDADDVLPDGALSELKQAIETHDCDLVLYNLTCIKQDGSQEEFKLDLTDGKVYEGDEKKQVYLQRYNNDYLNSMCTKAVRKDLIDTDVDYSVFRNLYKGTDIFQSYPILDKAEKILYLNKSLYLYDKRDQSLTTSFKSKWYDAKKILWNRDDEYLDKWQIDDGIKKKMFYSRIKEIISFVDTIYFNRIDKKTAKELLKKIRKDGLLQSWFDYVGKKAIKIRHRLYCKCIIKGRYCSLAFISFISRLLMKR